MTPSLAPALRFEFDRAQLPRQGEALARLLIETPAPSAPTPGAARKGLAFAAALDASGSMNEAAGAPDGSPMRLGRGNGFFRAGSANSKMARCKAGLWEAVSLLGPDDMASLTVYSSMAATLFPLAPMNEQNKALFKAALDKVEASGGTALEAGWREAAREAAKGIDHGLLCRVALFTDGQASCGERDPEKLAAMAAGLAEVGVGTSCFGVGASFNEDLLCAMADAGEGNFRYIPDAVLAASAAIDEVNGLGATAGRKALLRIEGIGANVEVLNAFDRDADGALKLPSLLAGRPIEIVIRMKLEGDGPDAGVLARLEWSDRDGVRQSHAASGIAPVGEAEACLALAQNAEVAGAAAALLAASRKAEMAQSLARGDLAGASASLESARSILASCSAYSGSVAEMADLDSLAQTLAKGDSGGARKAAVFQSYARSKNQTVAGPAGSADLKP